MTYDNNDGPIYSMLTAKSQPLILIGNNGEFQNDYFYWYTTQDIQYDRPIFTFSGGGFNILYNGSGWVFVDSGYGGDPLGDWYCNSSQSYIAPTTGWVSCGTAPDAEGYAPTTSFTATNTDSNGQPFVQSS